MGRFMGEKSEFRSQNPEVGSQKGGALFTPDEGSQSGSAKSEGGRVIAGKNVSGGGGEASGDVRV
jgi:hypothetical protein